MIVAHFLLAGGLVHASTPPDGGAGTPSPIHMHGEPNATEQADLDEERAAATAFEVAIGARDTLGVVSGSSNTPTWKQEVCVPADEALLACVTWSTGFSAPDGVATLKALGDGDDERARVLRCMTAARGGCEGVLAAGWSASEPVPRTEPQPERPRSPEERAAALRALYDLVEEPAPPRPTELYDLVAERATYEMTEQRPDYQAPTDVLARLRSYDVILAELSREHPVTGGLSPTLRRWLDNVEDFLVFLTPLLPILILTVSFGRRLGAFLYDRIERFLPGN